MVYWLGLVLGSGLSPRGWRWDGHHQRGLTLGCVCRSAVRPSLQLVCPWGRASVGSLVGPSLAGPVRPPPCCGVFGHRLDDLIPNSEFRFCEIDVWLGPLARMASALRIEIGGTRAR